MPVLGVLGVVALTLVCGCTEPPPHAEPPSTTVHEPSVPLLAARVNGTELPGPALAAPVHAPWLFVASPEFLLLRYTHKAAREVSLVDADGHVVPTRVVVRAAGTSVELEVHPLEPLVPGTYELHAQEPQTMRTVAFEVVAPPTP